VLQNLPKTSYRPKDHPALILLTVACPLKIHMCEEYLDRFGPAMSRLFDITWTEKTILMIFAFIGPVIYTITALGLYYRSRLAGFIAWFIFYRTRCRRFTHFIFPFVKPDLLLLQKETLSQNIKALSYRDA